MKLASQIVLYMLLLTWALPVSHFGQTSTKVTREIYLIGNTGDAKKADRFPAIDLLIQHIGQAKDPTTILFMGNIFPNEVFKKDVQDLEAFFAGKEDMENYRQLKESKAQLLFMPGEREWNYEKVPSISSVENVSYLIEKNLNRGSSFFPSHGCPGPHELVIDENTVILFIDTQWWLSKEKVNAETENLNCDVQTQSSLLIQLKDAIHRHKDKHVIVAGYHPIRSFGPHNGYLPVYTHFLPPIFGSFYYLQRNWVGNYDDFANPVYKNLIAGLNNIFQGDQEIIYVSGHEHSMQYIPQDNTHQIISGAGGSKSHVKKTTDSFAASEYGFMKLVIYDNREIWLQSWMADGTDQGKKILEQKLYTLELPDPPIDIFETIDFSGLAIDTMASNAYGPPKSKPGLMGNNYRSEWQEPLKDVPFLNIGTEKGGLTPIKRGGGMQTRSLRLENEKGSQYVLRSIEKYPENALPKELRNTVAADLFRDFISSSHPYAALVIPPLADLVGVYHTNPKVIFLPDDPHLGIYRKDFANDLYLYEERPMKKHKGLDCFGNPDDIISTNKMLQKRYDDHNMFVDQQHVLKSRLFDMLIGDWDRHEDQWRWAQFGKKEKRQFFRPIPRDRDQAFFYNDGLIIKYGARPPGVSKFQGFDYKIRDINGFNYNGRHFDRTFLIEPDWKDWQAAVRFLQENMTDESIEAAIRQLPEEIYQYRGDEVIGKLKSRRDDLMTYAREYYLFLSKALVIPGTNKREWFAVNRLSDEETKITIRSMPDEGSETDTLIFERLFLNKETKEIHLYGLGGDDLFTIDGKVNNSPVIRIVGGFGNDEINNRSVVKGLAKKTFVYDAKEGITINNTGKLSDRRSNHAEINTFNRESFKYNSTRFLGYIDISPDDGVFLSADIKTINYFLRKNPYRWTQQYQVRWSPKINSFKIRYRGDFIDVFGSWDINLFVDAKYPSYTNYYYGLGNESPLDESLRLTRYYHFSYGNFDLQPMLRHSTKGYKRIFEVGPVLNMYRLNADNPENRKFQEDFPDADLGKWAYYPGLRLGYHIDTRNDKRMTFYGLHWRNSIEFITKIKDSHIGYTRIATDFALFQTVGGSQKTILGLRVGGTATIGNYEFYQSADLGGKSNLRGHRRLRFSGDHRAFVNIDIRHRLFRFSTFLFPGSFGLYGFFDAGRVWYKDDDGLDPTVPSGLSELWHAGFGGGLWIAPLRKYVFTADISNSTTDGQLLFNLRYGFFF